MSSIKDRVVIITGASSGIGEEAVKALAAKGAKLILGARRVDRLEQIAEQLKAQGCEVRIQQTDVTNREEVQALADLALTEFGRIDVIINNAGLMPLSFMSQAKVDEWDQMVDVNIKGVLYGIAAVIGHMKQQGAGHIINVASIAGHTVFPTGGVYCATKHAVRALSEGIRQEEQQIRTTVISPGSVATELPNTISDDRIGSATKKAYEEAISVESIGQAIVWAMEQPENVDVNEIVIRPVTQKQ